MIKDYVKYLKNGSMVTSLYTNEKYTVTEANSTGVIVKDEANNIEKFPLDSVKSAEKVRFLQVPYNEKSTMFPISFEVDNFSLVIIDNKPKRVVWEDNYTFSFMDDKERTQHNIFEFALNCKKNSIKYELPLNQHINYNKKRLFVDMDGVLAKWNSVASLEELEAQGYFLNLEPQMNVVNAIKELINSSEFEVYILSACMDTPYAMVEKNEWLNKYLPEVNQSHRLFSAIGQDKKAIVPNGVCQNDFLLDDHTPNLMKWIETGNGIKLINDVNNKTGSCTCPKVDYMSLSLVDDIINISHENEIALDKRRR